MCAKDNQFGQFQFEVSGPIEAVRLVHLSGQVSRHDQLGRKCLEQMGMSWAGPCVLFFYRLVKVLVKPFRDMCGSLHLKLNTISIEKENLKRIEIRRILNNEKNMAGKINVISQD